MDTLTHALSGALLARATAPGAASFGALTPRARMTAGFAAAAFPDCDFALRLVDTLTYLNWHQGITHSVVLMPVWSWALAHLFSRLSGRRHPWEAFYVVAVLGISIHIAGDLITAYGTMLFAPFSTQRYAIPLAFVIDPYLTAILGTGVALFVMRPHSRRAAVVSLVLVLAYVALLGNFYFRALEVGREYAVSRGTERAATHALPQPLAPFNWKIVVSMNEEYHETHVNLWRRQPRPARTDDAGPLKKIFFAYQSVSMQEWQRRPRFSDDPSYASITREAWNHPGFEPFRRFAVFPAMASVDVGSDRLCVWFYDLRFSIPELTPSFRYGMCRGGSAGDWQLSRMPGLFWID